jgi:hypothetical protein
MIQARSEKGKTHMDESEFRSLAKWQISMPPRYSENRIQYLLKTEEQILQSISARAPISKILNDICNALDCEIGNMVSLISMPDDDTSSAVEGSRSAALFGLHSFFSVAIWAETGELLGSLEMYSCVSRNPTPREFQLIERAVCLTAAAIKRHRATIDGGNCRMHGVRSARGYVPETPTSMN